MRGIIETFDNGLDPQKATAAAASAAGATAVSFTTPGTYTWAVPVGVTSISAVCIGAGGGPFSGNISGYGGDLRWRNAIPVAPGDIVTVVVGAGVLTGAGGNSSISVNADSLVAGGGRADGSVQPNAATTALSATVGGGNGGTGGAVNAGGAGGGGGAGGYNDRTNATDTGGAGGRKDISSGGVSTYGSANGGDADSVGGQYAQGGGGTGLEGVIRDLSSTAGRGGSGGGAAPSAPAGLGAGGDYGGGSAGNGGTTSGARSGNGAVRIVWGANRSFPFRGQVN